MSPSTFASAGVSALLPLDTSPSLSSRERVRRFLHLSTYRSGLSSLYARLQDEPVATILMYHSVPTLDEDRWIDPYNSLSARAFEQQMQFLAQHRQVISMEALVQKLERREPFERGTVAITFDDGYRNNLTVAAPILAKYNLPATIYLATSYIDSGQNQWIDTLYAAFRARSADALSLANWALASRGMDDRAAARQGGAFRDWDLSDSAQQTEAYTELVMYLIEADLVQREALLLEIDYQLQPVAYPPRLTMNWTEAKALKDGYDNITLGVHTCNHLDLSKHSEKTAEEMSASIAQMMRTLEITPKHFAFPYNRYCQHAQSQVEAAQLSSAVMATDDDPVVRSHTSPYALPRLEAPKSMAMLKSWTNGGFPDTSRRIFNQPWICPY